MASHRFRELALTGAEARALRKHPNVLVLDDYANTRHCCRECARYLTTMVLLFGVLLVGVYALSLVGLYDRWLGRALTFKFQMAEPQGGAVPQGAYLGSTAEAIRKQYQI